MLPCSVVKSYCKVDDYSLQLEKGKKKGILLKSVDLYCKAVFTNQFYDHSLDMGALRAKVSSKMS